jgi:hypothetical protein
MALPSYKDILELIKKGATVEAQEQIMALREAALELQVDNFALRERVKSLEEALRNKGQLQFDGAVYWLNEDGKLDGPFCQHCYDVNSKLVRLQDWSDSWLCYACKHTPGKRKR